jgi:general secretion pathway protein I
MANSRRIPRRRRSAAAGRHGMTLLEVVLALAIFFGAMAALAQLTWNGTRAALQARFKAQAVIRCETKLAELVSGAELLQSQSSIPFPDDSAWTWSAMISPGSFPELLQVEVRVRRTGSNSLGSIEYGISRWMRDPAVLAETATLADEAAASSTSSSSSSSSSDGGTSQ